MLRLAIVAAVGFLAVRRLLNHDLPAETPDVLRAPLEAAQACLRNARATACEAIQAGRRATGEAERELTADYHRRAGRK